MAASDQGERALQGRGALGAGDRGREGCLRQDVHRARGGAARQEPVR